MGALIFEHNCGGLWVFFSRNSTSINFIYCMCDSRNCPYPLPPPPHDGQWKFLGGGGLKGRNFRRVSGVPTRRILHRVVKDTIDRMSHTWIIFICSTTTTRNRCPFKKKLKRYLSQMSSSLLGVCSVSLRQQKVTSLWVCRRKIKIADHSN